MKLPFKVSARTARLIGRENVSNAEGAIIELVKNAYDADASVCIIFLDNKYEKIPASLTDEKFEYLSSQPSAPAALSTAYVRSNDCYLYDSSELDDAEKQAVAKFFKKRTALYIIDNGEGMTEEIIQNCWMTIGTNNKQRNFITNTGRVKAGEKGIGRFALDRLGGRCKVFTKPNKNIHNVPHGFDGLTWNVKWSDFEGDGKNIDEVTAVLRKKKGLRLEPYIQSKLEGVAETEDVIAKNEFKSGTIIRISQLRDSWNETSMGRIFSNLELLLPPKEVKDFEIYFFTSSMEGSFGKVETSACEDFDYKVQASADDNQNVSITITRREYDYRKIDKRLFDRPKMKKFPYDKETFTNGVYSVDYKLNMLIPGFSVVDEDNTLSKIGSFDFTFYFMKKTMTNDDLKRFGYKDFNSSTRQKWLNTFGGIKIFRDNFRVRPYGEKGSTSDDWLGLGDRQAGSPAGIAKVGGGYKVRPYNISGAINISRVANVFFEDKSSREGLQETKEFEIFKKIIIGIIGLFEKDRSYIATELDLLHQHINAEEDLRKKAEEIAKRIKEKQENEKGKSTEDPEKEILAAHAEYQREKIEELRSEQKLLRALASAGAITASFAHELNNLNSKLVTRLDQLKTMVNNLVSEDQIRETPRHKNPLKYIEDMKKQDERLKHWLNFAINSIRKDKRRRKNINLLNYFQDFASTWQPVLDDREVIIHVTHENCDDLKQRFFEIDLDSIFNNLLVNSLDAFQRKDAPVDRDIFIKLQHTDELIKVTYSDSGPGLSPDIISPEQVFDCFFTTKKHKVTGEDLGTGIGMWLVKSIVEDNDGDVKLLFPEKGFGVDMEFKKKYRRN